MKKKRCKQCKEYFEPPRPLAYICSPSCAALYQEVKRKEKQEKAWKKQKEKMVINVTKWKDKLQTEVQKIARYIDYGLLCLARDQGGQIHGGHVYSKKSSPNIRFDLHNIHRQSAQSNKWESDDILLREKLVEEYGQEYWDNLREIRNRREQVKYPNEVYHAFYLKARKIANRLAKENKKLLKPRSVRERIELRDQINRELNIYHEYKA